MLDLTKPITTRDGRPVVIYTTEAPGKYPIHGLVQGRPYPDSWTLEGNYFTTDMYQAVRLNLVNAVPKIKMLKGSAALALYPEGGVAFYHTIDDARAKAPNAVAYAVVSWEVEEGAGRAS